MSIAIGVSKRPHAVGVLCLLRPEFCLGISVDFLSVACLLKIVQSLVEKGGDLRMLSSNLQTARVLSGFAARYPTYDVSG